MTDKAFIAHALLSPCGLPGEDYGFRRYDVRTPPEGAVVPREWGEEDLVPADLMWEKTAALRAGGISNPFCSR